MPEYVRVAKTGEVAPGEGKAVDVGARRIAIFNIDGTFYAIDDTCTHRGGPLSEGKLEGNSIRCPWHGSRFCLEDGAVLDGPAVFPERPFDVRVREGKIQVRARKEA